MDYTQYPVDDHSKIKSDNYMDERLQKRDYPLYQFVSHGSIMPDHSEQLNKIEQKLDKLLAILDKDKGIWIAPGPINKENK